MCKDDAAGAEAGNRKEEKKEGKITQRRVGYFLGGPLKEVRSRPAG
jgi:hypothetical protein